MVRDFFVVVVVVVVVLAVAILPFFVAVADGGVSNVMKSSTKALSGAVSKIKMLKPNVCRAGIRTGMSPPPHTHTHTLACSPAHITLSQRKTRSTSHTD